MTIFKPMACGFHEHTDIGSLDGASTVESKVKRAKELGRVADCTTDHGTMTALASQWKYCKKHKMQCIHGIEAYVLDPFNPTYLDKRGKVQKSYAHLTIHFKTQKAYQYFCSLTPKMEERAVVRYGERKPIILLDEIEAASGEIVLGSGCLVGLTQKYLKDNEAHKSIQMYERLRSIAGPGNFFVELFPHHVTHEWTPTTFDDDGRPLVQGHFVEHECGMDGMPHDYQKKPNQFLLELAKRYGDPALISEDSHFSQKEDKIVQDAKLGNGAQRWKFFNSLHMLSSEEAAESLKHQIGVSDRDIEEYIDNSYKFVDLFKGYTFATADDKLYLPRMQDIYEIKTETTTKAKLGELIVKHGKFPKKDHPKYKEYAERLKREVAVIADNGVHDLLPYFFVLEDICSFCTREGMLFNARGSAGGSLILFLLGGSITDPIRYNLSFERFLTLGRIQSKSLPDIDMDFSDQTRVFEYLQKKYGDKFIRISISKPLKVKSSIKDVERDTFGHVRPETEALTRSIPVIPQGVTDDQWLFGYEDDTTGEHVKGFIEIDAPAADGLRKYRDDNPEIWNTVLKCLGVQREKSSHACLAGDTLVQDRAGIIPFKEAKSSFGKDISVWSSGVKDCVLVTLNNGISTVMTPDHKVMISDREVEAKDILQMEVDYRPFEQVFGIEQLDKETAFFAGWLLNDGTLTKDRNRGTAYFTLKKDDEIRTRFLVWLERLGVKYWASEDRPDRVIFGKTNFPNLLEHPTISLDSRLPAYFWKLNPSTQSEFMNGLWSANGFVLSSRPVVGLKLMSPLLISDVASWLHAHGINTTVSISHPKTFVIRGKAYTNKGALQLCLARKSDIGSFSKVVTFFQNYKQDLAVLWATGSYKKKASAHRRPIKAVRCIRIAKWKPQEVFDFNEPQSHTSHIGGILVHNCGALIACDPIQSFMPVLYVSDTLCTAYGPKEVEYVGGIKFDFLGVKHLKALEIVMKLINKDRAEGNKLKWEEFGADDRVFTQVLSKGLVRGLFQVNTDSMKPLIAKIKPVNLSQITDIMAICRPAVLDAPSPDGEEGKNAADFYIQCNNGSKTPYIIHEDLAPYVKNTFGLLLYQEQQIAIAKAILDLNDAQGEEFRRAIGKKDKTLMIAKVTELRAGCLRKGWSEEQSDLLCASYMAASRYSFNASHARSYGLVTYNGAWLKVNYPLQFWKGLLTAYSDDRADIRDFLEECSDVVLPVNALTSDPAEWTIANQKLIPPLIMVKGVGEKASEGIREFLDADLSQYVRKPIKEKKARAAKKKPENKNDLAFGEDV